MKHTTKKITAFVLTILLIIGMIPSIAIPATAEVSPTSGSCGENATWELDTATGTLTISGTGAMKDYGGDGGIFKTPPYYSRKSSIKNVVIEDGITSIGNYMFYECDKLTSITIPDTVTTIGDNAFQRCTALKSIDLPDTVNSIGEEAFYSCESLTEFTIPKGVTSLEYHTFFGCSGIKKFNFHNKFTHIGPGAFSSCSGLKKIDLPDSVTFIDGLAFGWCSGLTEFKFPPKVTKIESTTFAGCTGFKSFTIPKHITSIGDFAFQECTGFTSFTIPDWITTIETGTFYGCTNLKSIYIPNSVTSIGTNAFLNCSGLTHVTIPKSVKKISGSTFRGCTSLVSISIPNTVTEIWNNAFQDCPKLKRVILPKNIKIEGNPLRENKSATLYSYAGSTAKKFAAENDIPFVALDAKTPFKDVPNKSWYDKSVRFAYNYGLVKGMTKTTFEPETPMSRAMLVTVLYRMENSPKISTKTKFKDVKSEDWYAKAVAWASKNGIVNGMTEKTFEPNTQITRAQMVTMLYRYAQFCNRDISAKKSLKSFPDYKKVPDWAEDAMKWAIADEIINGMDGKIAPNGNATRAQVATILSRYIQQ